MTGIPETYYPVLTGTDWVYDVNAVAPDSSVSAYINEMQITGTKLVAGADAWVFRESNPSGDGVAVDSYYAKDARAFVYLGDNSSADWLNSIIRQMDFMRFDGTFSQTPLLDRKNADIATDLDGDGKSERIDIKVTGVVEGYETLVLGAGSFSNTARIRYDIAGTLTLSAGGSVPITETVHEWRANGIGAIRQTVQATVGTQTSTDTSDLRAVSVNGVKGGVFPAHDLLTGLASADSDATRPGRPALSSDGTRYLLVSNSQGASGRQWIGQFIAADGTLQQNIALSGASLSSLEGAPAVASDGNTHLVVMRDEAGLHAQRVSSAGGLLDTYPGAILAANGRFPAVAYGNGQYLVAYYNYGPVQSTIRGLLVSSSGVVGADFLIGTAISGYADIPAVAFDGRDFIVAWETGSSGLPDHDIVAARVNTAGALLDPVPISVSTAPDMQFAPRIACDPVNCLITWTDRRNYVGLNYAAPGDMYGTFITREGVVLNGPPASGGLPLALGITTNSGDSSLVYAASGYVLAWSQGAYVNSPGGPTGVYARRIGTDGSVSPAAPGLAVSGAPQASTRLYYPALASISTGTLAVWLNNSEAMGDSKSIRGALMWPPLSR
ncbi:MAG: hypothetical protein JSR83_02525 [Proteobacteria bacterium]|nr:hypothetical protein [Pseudomonadota bacterium]